MDERPMTRRHIMHCFEVVGFRHPDAVISNLAGDIYTRLVNNLHLNPETRGQFAKRLSEDRIAKGTVVS